MKKLLSSQMAHRGWRTMAAATLLSLGSLGLVGWFVAAPIAQAQAQCTVCHKLTTTLMFACGSIEYRRHIDHGDPMMACRVTETQNP